MSLTGFQINPIDFHHLEIFPNSLFTFDNPYLSIVQSACLHLKWDQRPASKQINFHAYRHLQNLLGFTSNAEKDNLEMT